MLWVEVKQPDGAERPSPTLECSGIPVFGFNRLGALAERTI